MGEPFKAKQEQHYGSVIFYSAMKAFEIFDKSLPGIGGRK
jgi:hypothetical protein